MHKPTDCMKCLTVNNGDFYNEDTMFKVLNAILRCGLTEQAALELINELQNEGILFRERMPNGSANEGTEKEAGTGQIRELHVVYNQPDRKGSPNKSF